MPALTKITTPLNLGKPMAFRKARNDKYRRDQEWQVWIDANRAELVAIGLPAEVYLDADRWLDFLENGHLHWHESSGFEFGHLSPKKLNALHRFLEREYGTDEKSPHLLSYVRVRCRP